MILAYRWYLLNLLADEAYACLILQQCCQYFSCYRPSLYGLSLWVGQGSWKGGLRNRRQTLYEISDEIKQKRDQNGIALSVYQNSSFWVKKIDVFTFLWYNSLYDRSHFFESNFKFKPLEIGYNHIKRRSFCEWSWL